MLHNNINNSAVKVQYLILNATVCHHNESRAQKKKGKDKNKKVLYEVIDALWIHKLLTVVQSGSI